MAHDPFRLPPKIPRSAWVRGKKQKTKPNYFRNSIALFTGNFTHLYQEPITRSIQLPCIRATAFSQVGLFLDLSVFPVKISVSDDVHIEYTKFHKWNIGQALSDLNEFWCRYFLSASSYSSIKSSSYSKPYFPQYNAF